MSDEEIAAEERQVVALVQMVLAVVTVTVLIGFVGGKVVGWW